MGTPWENIFLLNNGDIFEYQNGNARIGGFTNAAGVLIDGSGMGDVDSLVLRDRLLLADDGVVSVFIALDSKTGEIIGQPDIQAKGFIYESEVEKTIDECRRKINLFAAKASSGNKPLAAMIRSGALRDQLRDLLFERTRRRPMILVSIIEI
jgi:ribonuclease J